MQREPLVPHDPAQSLLAGGIVALKAKLPATDEMRTTAITARAYSHPGLDGKIIVRLEPEAVADGTDAEMAAFGFTAPKVSATLGNVRYRTLGFPAWGLVNAPKTAKVALGVMEDVRKAKRMVAAKPGHAKEAFEKIAKTLQKASPMLLPSFWEEVGRTVADLASATMAAQCFERARQAERAFKLKVDADDSDAVFVEFALLGALSAKTLSQYAKDLAKSEGGALAYKRFRSIAVKRALGGMPPWSGMGKDIRSLAKAAKLDLDAEDESLVAELIEAPAIGKAPTEFWTTYRDAMIRLAQKNVAVRARLRALWPDPRGGTRENRDVFRKGWIDVLDEVGALADLPDAELGTWVSRLLSYAGVTDRITALLRELTPRLKTQPIAVLTPRSRWGTDLNLDLAEFALELGIPLVDPKSDDFYPESMTCDPVRVAAHEMYGKKLVEAVASMIGESEHEHRMRGKKGFEVARRAWVEERLGKLAAHPISCTSSELDTIESKTTADTYLPFQDLWTKLRTTELAEPLAAQLRAGIADEFGWPAYEKALATLDGPASLGGAFPILVAWTAAKAIAIDRTGVIAEHDFVYKVKEHKIDDVIYVGGQFYVTLDPVKGWGTTAYWSGNPKQRFEPEHGISSFVFATTLPDGSVTLSGNRAFRPGDTKLSGTDNYFTDGTKFWRYDYREKGSGLRELDPTKEDARIGVSLPEFFARPWPTPEPEPRPDWYHSQLHVAPPGLTSSPLGIANGLVGMRVRRLTRNNDDDDINNIQYERIDGVIHEDTGGYGGLVKFPGATVLKAIEAERVSNARFPGGSGIGVELWDGGHSVKLNEQDWASRGWGLTHVPPSLFWHYLEARDEAGSAALRAITTAQAAAILASARKELVGDTSGRVMPATEALVKQTLGITDPKLVRGVVGIAEYAAELALRLDTVAAERAKENADPGGEGLTKEGMQLRKMCTALIAGRATRIPDFEIDPRDWIRDGRVSALKSLLPIADDDERRKARDMMRALADSPLADAMATVRMFSISEPDDWSDPEDYNTLVIKKQDGSVFAIHGSDNWAIEYTTDGTFRVPSPWTIDDEKKLTAGVGKEWARAFCALPDERVPWDPAIGAALAERAGLSVPEATLLYLGMPSGWGKDFLGKQKRELVSLKMGEADAARTTFEELDDDKKHALIAKAIPDDASLLHTPLAAGGYVELLGMAWKQKFGKRTKAPQELIAAVKKDLGSVGREIAKYLPPLTGEDDVAFLKPDLRPFHELGGWNDDNGLTHNTGSELATLIAWLFLQRPVGDQIRTGLASVVDKLVKIVNDNRVIWKLDDRYTGDEPKDETYRQSLFQMVGGKPIELPKSGDEECKLARDDGAIVIAQYGTTIATGFRPAKLEGAARKKVETLAKAVFDAEDSGGAEADLRELKVSDLLRSEGFAAFAERVRDTPVPAGSFEANPAVSVPKLVTKVAKSTGLSSEAAALYLQVLALAEPTERAVQAFNGWTAKQYKAAAAELAKKKLVVEGKRERAGRGIFLKGGYSKGADKDLPMEDWKQPYYGMLERHVPAEPCHLLFARVWKRVEDGDKPA